MHLHAFGPATTPERLPANRRGRAVRRLSVLSAALAFALVTALGCGKDEKPPLAPLPPDSKAPDFSLQDVNPASPTGGQDVSVRSKLGKVSAWYFGHAT